MSTQEALVERRTGSHLAIEKLVEHRNQMLAIYGELAANRPFTPNHLIFDLLQRFCQALVDYTADAHFRLYRFFEINQERRASVAKVAQDIYPSIQDSTQRILDFNDKYDTSKHYKQSLSDLEKDLSEIGERLADRIELEDRLVEVLCQPRTK